MTTKEENTAIPPSRVENSTPTTTTTITTIKTAGTAPKQVIFRPDKEIFATDVDSAQGLNAESVWSWCANWKNKSEV